MDRGFFGIVLFIFREEALRKYVEKQREKARTKSEHEKVQVRFTISRFSFLKRKIKLEIGCAVLLFATMF